MKAVKLLLTSLTVILLVLTLVAIESKIGVDRTVLNPEHYNNILEKHNLYNISQNYALYKIKSNYDQEVTEPVCKAVQEAINRSFSAEWTRQQATALLYNFIDYAKSDNESLSLSIELGDRKEIFKKELSVLMEEYAVKQSGDYRIDSSTAALIAADIYKALEIPDKFDLGKSKYLQNSVVLYYIELLRDYYSYFMYLPYLALALFIILYFLAGWKRGTKLSGIALLISGIILVLLIAAGSKIIDQGMIHNISKQDELLASMGVNPIILAALYKKSITAVLYRIGVGTCIFGAAVTIIGAYLNRKKRHPSMEKQPYY